MREVKSQEPLDPIVMVAGNISINDLQAASNYVTIHGKTDIVWLAAEKAIEAADADPSFIKEATELFITALRVHGLLAR
jgi:hypothetical protein